MHKIKKIVDLSWEFTADTPIYPGDPEPSVTVATTLENEGYNLSTLVMGTQTGSHVDAPYHFSNEGATIDQMELDFFLGDAIVVRVTDKKAEEAITMEDIEPYKEQITPGKIVLFNTNWYKKRGTEEFFHHPYVNGEVAHYLVDQGVRFIGIDTINADQTGGTEFPVHDLFSEKRLMIGENWAYFDKIDFENPYVIAIPMKVVGCDGSPEWGSDPLTTFEIGLSNVFHVQLGTAALVFEGIVFFVFLIIRRDLVHLGTLAWCFLIGPFENVWLDFLAPILPPVDAMSFGLKVGCIIAGSLIIILTLAYYIPIGLGYQSSDIFAFAMADLLHKSYGIGLSVSYCILFALGVFMGASWGIGTLIAVFVYGPVIDRLLPYFKPYTYKIAGMTDEKDD